MLKAITFALHYTACASPRCSHLPLVVWLLGPPEGTNSEVVLVVFHLHLYCSVSFLIFSSIALQTLLQHLRDGILISFQSHDIFIFLMLSATCLPSINLNDSLQSFIVHGWMSMWAANFLLILYKNARSVETFVSPSSLILHGNPLFHWTPVIALKYLRHPFDGGWHWLLTKRRLSYNGWDLDIPGKILAQMYALDIQQSQGSYQFFPACAAWAWHLLTWKITLILIKSKKYYPSHVASCISPCGFWACDITGCTC